MNYVKKLETASDLKVVPQHEDNPWNYKIYSKLCRLIMKKVDRDVAEQMGHGWDRAFNFHVKGWTQNDLSVEEVQYTMPFVLRFLDIVEKELAVNREMALYVKEKGLNDVYQKKYAETFADVLSKNKDGINKFVLGK